MKRLNYLVLLISILFILAACQTTTVDNIEKVKSNNETTVEETNYKDLLNSAKEIKISENVLSLNKSYSIYVNDEEVAIVSGKILKDWGDKFTLKTLNDELLATEKEIKRWGTSLTRLAEITDSNGNTKGYIGEEVKSKMFSVGYYFHFYDIDKTEVGVSDQVNFSLFKENNFLDSNGNYDYKVEKNFDLTDSYILTVNDKTEIDLYTAIFMVCIEDAIKDAEEDE